MTEEHCGICLQGSEEEVLKQFSCLHNFHDSCYSQWCQTQSEPIYQCMYCTKNIKEEVIQSYQWRYYLESALSLLNLFFMWSDYVLILLFSLNGAESIFVCIFYSVWSLSVSIIFKFVLLLIEIEYILGTRFIRSHFNNTSSEIPNEEKEIICLIMYSINFWWITLMLYYLTKLHRYYYPSQLTIRTR